MYTSMLTSVYGNACFENVLLPGNIANDENNNFYVAFIYIIISGAWMDCQVQG